MRVVLPDPVGPVVIISPFGFGVTPNHLLTCGFKRIFIHKVGDRWVKKTHHDWFAKRTWNNSMSAPQFQWLPISNVKRPSWSFSTGISVNHAGEQFGDETSSVHIYMYRDWRYHAHHQSGKGSRIPLWSGCGYQMRPGRFHLANTNSNVSGNSMSIRLKPQFFQDSQNVSFCLISVVSLDIFSTNSQTRHVFQFLIQQCQRMFSQLYLAGARANIEIDLKASFL